ncbi:hypothetical protein [Kitasatospora sp. NPDC057223]|uniref:hypothetical protein n=1 Tax=Kitasatospora sp. NPDC057223 TaxID=3346055 RepID=UPI0036430742
MDDTQNTPVWDGVERRKYPAGPAPAVPAAAGPVRRSVQRIAEGVLAQAGGNLLNSGLQLLVLYVLTR